MKKIIRVIGVGVALILSQIIMMIPILNVFIYWKSKEQESLLNLLKKKLYIIRTEDDAEVSFVNLDVLSRHGDKEDFERVERWLEE